MAIAGKATSGTTTIVSDITGPRHRSHRSDVFAVQDLLVACGHNVGRRGPDGRWGDATSSAFEAFQKADPSFRSHVRDFILPSDPRLISMAEQAGILLPLPAAPGIKAFRNLHAHLKDLGVKYDLPPWDKAFWGLVGYGWAVMTTGQRYKKGPVKLDCTTYVNVMLSACLHGNIHWADYKAGTGEIGGTGKNLVKHHYGIHGKAGVFSGRGAAQKILDAVDKAKLYVIMCGDTARRARAHLDPASRSHHDMDGDAEADVGFVHHQGCLYDGRAYHAKYNDKVTDERLADFCTARPSQMFYVLGPIE